MSKVFVCPTITATSKEDYQRQLKSLKRFATRLHLDISDGTLAHRELLGLGSMRWPKKIQADIHAMSRHPHAEMAIALELRPHLVILHAEAETDLKAAAQALRAHHIKAGLALLPETSVHQFAQIIHDYFDHVLIFSGNLGYQGGSSADLSLLPKVHELRQMKPALEIGWDGGINELNAAQLLRAGVNVLNVGGYIARATKPNVAYAKLEEVIKSHS